MQEINAKSKGIARTNGTARQSQPSGTRKSHIEQAGLFMTAFCLISVSILYGQQGGAGAVLANAGQAAESTVPRLINFSGVLKDSSGKAMTGTVTLTLSLYAEQEGGTPLWSETQSVQLDDQGHYSLLLGATQPNGLPLDLFTSDAAQWLGVQPALPGTAEQARVLLVGMPYALKASDADTLGGLPVSAFVQAGAQTQAYETGTAGSASTQAATGQASPLALSGSGTTNYIPIWSTSTKLGNSALYQTGGNIGIGNTTPAGKLDVTGSAVVRGTLQLPAIGTATSSSGFTSQPLDVIASAFNSSTSAAVNQDFRWQTEPTGNNTTSPSGTLNLLFGSGGSAPAETGLSIASSGQITFATGQTFPGAGGSGTITGVTAGTDLTGGGTSGNVTLNLNTGALNGTYAQLAASNSFIGDQRVTGNLTASGTVSGSSLTGNGSGLTNVNAVQLNGQPSSYYATQGGFNTFENSQAFYGNGLFMYTGDPGCGSGFAGIGFGQLSGCNNYALVGSITDTFLNRPSGGTMHFRENNADEMTIYPGGALVAVATAPLPGTANAIALTGQTDTDTGIGVYGYASGGHSTGVVGYSPFYAGTFYGPVFVEGDLQVSGSITAGTKDFKIDHPLDPANKYLYHASVESSEMMNIYTGNVTTDEQGNAMVELPEWFESVNGDFRYQLTVMGQFAQAIVGSKISNHHFGIKTDKPNVEVSWQVTGVRHDAFAQAHPLVVEEDKPANERGYYIHPELYGQPDEKQIEWGRAPERMRDLKARGEQHAKASAAVKP